MRDWVFGRRVLVVAPHCDDEILGCGGLLLGAREQIDHLGLVHVVASVGARVNEASQVREALRIDNYTTLAGVDGGCSTVEQKCMEQLARVVQLERPDVVLTPHEKDDHPDHLATWRIVREAVLRARHTSYESDIKTHRARTILAYEVWTPIRKPSMVHDISKSFEKKCELMRLYRSQLENFPYVEYLASLNGWRGLLYQKGGYVEAYKVHAV